MMYEHFTIPKKVLHLRLSQKKLFIPHGMDLIKITALQRRPHCAQMKHFFPHKGEKTELLRGKSPSSLMKDIHIICK
jgi:hypothetical protein